MIDIKNLHQKFLNSSGISTDTRSIKPNKLFFALKGENFNGNQYAREAIKNGATYAIIDETIDETIDEKNDHLILVDDVLKTLQELASYHRNYLGIPVIALTGSNGKTTTKELITACLSAQFNITATKGNLNNHIGVPLTLLSMNSSTQIGVVEMGANHQKEIQALSKIAQPDYGLITNYGKAHLEGFGGIEGVIKGKSELYDHLRLHNKTAFVNADDRIQLEKSAGIERNTFGSSTADYPIDYLPETEFASVRFNGVTIKSNLTGFYNCSNIAAACAIAANFNVSVTEIKKAIENYVPRNNRSQIIKKNSATILLDAYNANPTSMNAALENLFKVANSYKIAILGDMFEVGKTALEEHQAIVNLAESGDINQLILIGETFGQTSSTEQKTKRFSDYNEAEAFLKGVNFSNTYCFIKASRGMALERIVDLIE
ncbi:UDP-N-acetylmuramoyl-tripeptide--D-alanyl-D-alanine ligase [Gangjinia marincola]|uniref:UDP-N-acetylmuramoyl-tripeptide--D-alanyl-D-alanine ligase n=1 Tax=Gangjinia marincola TaxID=578463 RepID=A0ABP3XYY2_9FLAO